MSVFITDTVKKMLSNRKHTVAKQYLQHGIRVVPAQVLVVLVSQGNWPRQDVTVDFGPQREHWTEELGIQDDLPLVRTIL